MARAKETAAAEYADDAYDYALVQAFLEAEGFEVEAMTPDPRSATQFTPQRRLVSPWEPIPEQGTTLPSTAGTKPAA